MCPQRLGSSGGALGQIGGIEFTVQRTLLKRLGNLLNYTVSFQCSRRSQTNKKYYRFSKDFQQVRRKKKTRKKLSRGNLHLAVIQHWELAFQRRAQPKGVNLSVQNSTFLALVTITYILWYIYLTITLKIRLCGADTSSNFCMGCDDSQATDMDVKEAQAESALERLLCAMSSPNPGRMPCLAFRGQR